MTPQVVLVLVTVSFSNALSILSKFQKSLGIFSRSEIARKSSNFFYNPWKSSDQL